uniref:Uncharacterized protein n=1 Tax=Echeneis naucrates TaxID=173247 RepID=A0A665TDE6_ECHNA
MEDGSLVGAPLSPESTVTSLLSSSGHLRSSLRAPEHSTSFRYRNKVHSSPTLYTYGFIFHSVSLSFTVHMFCLFPLLVLKESLTERELDFLDLPVSSLHHASNRDRLSMTTDELLSIPHDGSMPVTHTSAFIQGLFQVCVKLYLLLIVPFLCSFQSGRRAAGSEWTEPSSLRFCPDQFTSSKADMEHSGMSDMPDLKYDSNVEAWIQCCDRSKVYKLSDDHGKEPMRKLLFSSHDMVLHIIKSCRDSAAAAAGASTEPQSESRDQVVQNLNCCSHANSMEKQPGPVEALKQMLFRLQAVEVKLQGQQHVASVATADWRQAEETPMEQWSSGVISATNALHTLAKKHSLITALSIMSANYKLCAMFSLSCHCVSAFYSSVDCSDFFQAFYQVGVCFLTAFGLIKRD